MNRRDMGQNFLSLVPWVLECITVGCGILIIINGLFGLLTISLRPLGLVVCILALQALFINTHVRRFWLEIEFISFCLLVGAIWLSPSSLQLSQPSSDKNNAIFLLPSDKIQSDLVSLHPGNAILLLVTNNNVQRYQVNLSSIQGVSSDDPNPPYNKDVVKVRISLLRGTNDNVIMDFAKQLTGVIAIYILPT